MCHGLNLKSVTVTSEFSQRKQKQEKPRPPWNDLFGYTKYFKGKRGSAALLVYVHGHTRQTEVLQSRQEYIQ